MLPESASGLVYVSRESQATLTYLDNTRRSDNIHVQSNRYRNDSDTSNPLFTAYDSCCIYMPHPVSSSITVQPAIEQGPSKPEIIHFRPRLSVSYQLTSRSSPHIPETRRDLRTRLGLHILYSIVTTRETSFSGSLLETSLSYRPC